MGTGARLYMISGSSRKAIVALCSFFVLVFITSFLFNRHYPMLIIGGESSVGTWMSGVLLIMSATLCMVIGMQRHQALWFTVTAFFLLLAIDERFMFHEQMKERIIFLSADDAGISLWVKDLPVIAGTFAGVIVVYKLWSSFHGINRILLFFAMVSGSISVIIDILAAGVLWEESCKLLGELAMACALIREADKQN